MDAKDIDLEALGITPFYTIWRTSFWHTYWGYLLVAASIGLVVVGAVLVIYLLRRRSRTPEAVIEALLVQLAQEKPETNRQGREQYARLTAAVKKYLCARMALPRGLTDRQLVDRLSSNSEFDDSEQREALRSVISNAELAKFARMPVVEKLMKADIVRVRSLVAYVTRYSESRKQSKS